MLEYLDYPFFRLALIGVVLISISAAMIGTYIITRRLVAISGGITHACFGGLGLGYYLGLNPAVMAGVFAIGSSACVEWLSSKLNMREDSAIAVIWAVGMAIGVLFVFMTPGYVPELNSFLFGNILTISTGDTVAFAVFTLLLVTFFAFRYRQIVACAFDRDFATVINLPVKFISYTMTAMIAICIVLTIRLVGVMLLMSMFSLPMMTAEVFHKDFGRMMILSVIISVFSGVAGLFVGTLIDVPCSAIIVIIMAAVYLIARVCKTVMRRHAGSRALNLAVALSASFLLASCITDDTDTDVISVGDPLPDFSVTLDNGATITTGDLKGHVSLILFFSAKCSDCREVVPIVDHIYENYADRVSFVAISRAEGPEEVARFWNEFGLTMPYAARPDREIYNLFATSVVPRIYISEAAGIVRYIMTDNPNPDEATITSALDKLL